MADRDDRNHEEKHGEKGEDRRPQTSGFTSLTRDGLTSDSAGITAGNTTGTTGAAGATGTPGE